jgi:hypothetical protein
MFANDPVTNNYISAGLVLVTGEYGAASFQDILTISSIQGISSMASIGGVTGICSLSTVVTVGFSTLSTLFGSNGTFFYSTTNYFYETISTVYADGTNIFFDAQNVFLNLPFLSSYTLSTGFVSLSSLNFKDTANSSTQYLTVKNGQLLLNDSAISGDVSKTNLVSTVVGLGTAGYVSTASLLGLVSTANLSGLLSTGSISGLLSTGSILGLVSTANLQGLVSTPNLSGLISTANLQELVSTPNLLNLVSTSYFQNQLTSTVAGLGTTGYISSLSTINLSTQNLFTSTVTFKDINTGSNQILAVSSGTLILNGQGITGGGGGEGDVTTAQLVSTVENLAQLGYVSSSQLVSSLSSWALYPAISSIQLNSNQPYIINPNIDATAILQTGSLLIQDELATPGGVILNFVTFKTSTSQDNYTLINDEIASGSVSSFSLVHGAVNEMGSLYLSSIYFGNLGGSVYGQLTTDSTASDIYWNGISLTQGSGGGGITTAQLVSTVINFQTDFRTLQISTGFIQTSSVNLLDTYTSAQNFLTVSSGTLLLNGAAITGSGGGAVSQIVAGSNININPAGGTGVVTINNSINPTGLVSTANLSGLVSTANLIGLVSTANLSGLVSTTFFTNQVVSTVVGLGTAGYVSTASLTSTITAIGVFLSTISSSYAAYFYTNVGLISSLTVSSLTFGTGDGFLAMPDIRPTSMSTLVTQTSSLTTFNLLIGATSTVTAIQYFGLEGNFNNTVLAERSISTGVQEFLIFKGSSPADQIRFQTTGIFKIETGVSGQLWSTVTQAPVPAFIIDINSNVGIQTASPGATLDVAGSIRGQSLSTQQIQFSTLFGGFAQEQINSSVQITASSIYATLAGPVTFVLYEA